MSHVFSWYISGLTVRGFFAADYIAALDGVTKIPGGWINRNWIQLLHQVIDAVTGGLYSFTVTCLILLVMGKIPGLSLRISEEAEDNGMDDTEHGEFAYDFVEWRRECVPDQVIRLTEMGPTAVNDIAVQ